MDFEAFRPFVVQASLTRLAEAQRSCYDPGLRADVEKRLHPDPSNPLEQSLHDDLSGFLKVLDPLDTSTGGGTASAVAGAMAAALVAMVARLSKSNPAVAGLPSYDEIASWGTDLSADLMAGSREDSEAFEAVRSALRRPKQTEGEQLARRDAVQVAWTRAASVPLRNAELCARVLGLARALDGRSNPGAASDLDCAVYLARAGLLGCAANVRINLPSIKDPDAAAALARRLAEVLTAAGK